MFQIEITFNNNSEVVTIRADNFTKFFTPSDTHEFMRCYRADFPPKFFKDGISQIDMILFMKTKLFFHTYGMFFGQPMYAQKKLDLTLLNLYEFIVDSEVFEMLDLNGEPCNASIEYNRDDCITKQLLNVSSISFCKYRRKSWFN